MAAKIIIFYDVTRYERHWIFFLGKFNIVTLEMHNTTLPVFYIEINFCIMDSGLQTGFMIPLAERLNSNMGVGGVQYFSGWRPALWLSQLHIIRFGPNYQEVNKTTVITSLFVHLFANMSTSDWRNQSFLLLSVLYLHG